MKGDVSARLFPLGRVPPQRRIRQSGNLLVEVSLAMGFAVFLGLLAMRGSLLAISSNQWTIMQTLTDAYLSREIALSVREPWSHLTAVDSLWPEQGVAAPAQQTVTLGRLSGSRQVNAQLTRFRVNVTQADQTDSGISAWRLHSILDYTVSGQRYVKSRSTLRAQ